MKTFRISTIRVESVLSTTVLATITLSFGLWVFDDDLEAHLRVPVVLVTTSFWAVTVLVYLLDRLNSRVSIQEGSVRLVNWLRQTRIFKLNSLTSVSRVRIGGDVEYSLTSAGQTMRFWRLKKTVDFCREMTLAEGTELPSILTRLSAGWTVRSFSLDPIIFLWIQFAALGQKAYSELQLTNSQQALSLVLISTLAFIVFGVLNVLEFDSHLLHLSGDQILKRDLLGRESALPVNDIKFLKEIWRPFHCKYQICWEDRTLSFVSDRKSARPFCEALESQTGLTFSKRGFFG